MEIVKSMRKISLYIIIILISSCKNDFNQNNGITKDRFLMPSLPGDYVPKGLRKMSILEMKKLSEDIGIPPGIVYKNNKGEVVAKDYYATGPEPRFMQFYANKAGDVEESVVLEMTPEMKAMMFLMRVATLPVDDK